MIDYRNNENLSFEEYYDFLKRGDLGSQYPQERFEQRVRKLLTTRSIDITARNEIGLLIGVVFLCHSTTLRQCATAQYLESVAHQTFGNIRG